MSSRTRARSATPPTWVTSAGLGVAQPQASRDPDAPRPRRQCGRPMNRRPRQLTPDAYDIACDRAGSALLRRIPAGATILQVTDDKLWSEFRAAVYITADRASIVGYVGSSRRNGSVADRIQEHVLNGRADHWTRLMIVPLQPHAEAALVHKIEARVGTVLRPVVVLRLPRLGQPTRRRHLSQILSRAEMPGGNRASAPWHYPP
jgi:hypothetical protein